MSIRSAVIASFALLFVFSCSSDRTGIRKVGADIQGKWAFGLGGDCSSDFETLYIENDKWFVRIKELKTPEIVIAKNFRFKFVGDEILMDMELITNILDRTPTYAPMSIFYSDLGDTLDGVATHLKATDARVPLEMINLDAKLVPTFKLAKCS